MRRTWLSFDDDLWTVLQLQSRRQKTTVSELVRKAVRERYLENAAGRKAAMMGIVGMWKDRVDLPDTEKYIREVRKDRRSRPLRAT